jgi:adenylosuccinate synthase
MGVVIDLPTIAARSGISLKELEETEKGSVSGNLRRIAEFDWDQLRRSTELNGATDIALTFADYLGIQNRQAADFAQLLPATRRFVEDIERVSGRPVSLISVRFAKDGVIDRRGEN